MDSIVYSLEEEEEEKEEEDGEEEAGFNIKSNNPNLKGGEQRMGKINAFLFGPTGPWAPRAPLLVPFRCQNPQTSFRGGIFEGFSPFSGAAGGFFDGFSKFSGAAEGFFMVF